MKEFKLKSREGCVFILGAISLLLGVVVIIGWLTHRPSLIQIRHQFSPMQFNSAIGFVLGGLGLISLFYLRRLSAVIGIILFVLGSLTLLEYALPLNLGIDELFLKHTITVETSHPGRMGPNTALCFIFLGAGIFLASTAINQRWSAYLISILSLLIIFIGALSIIGYAICLPLSYGWGNFTSMSLLTAIGFVVLGAALFLLIHRSLEKKVSGFVLFIAPCFILILSGAFLAAESEKILLAIDLEKEHLTSRLSEYLVQKSQALERLQLQLQENEDASDEGWKNYVKMYFDHFPSLETIAWVNSNRKVLFLHSNHHRGQGIELPLADLSNVEEDSELPYFAIIEGEREEDKYIEMILPFKKKIDGYFIAIIHPEKFIETASYRFFLNKLHLIVSYKDKPLYLSSSKLEDEDLVSYARWKISDTMQINDLILLFTVWPKSRWLIALQGMGPFVILAIIISLTILGIILSHFVSSKLRLERQQALLLHSSGEGIFGLDLEGNTTFVNSAAAEMLGWKEEELMGKLLHSLIHHTKSDGSPYPIEDCPIHSHLKDERASVKEEDLFWRKDGSSFNVEYIRRPIIEKNQLQGVVVTFNDITERKKLEKELIKRTEELAASNKELEIFSYSVSHDLRAPLRQIIGFIELIKETKEIQVTEEAQKYFRYIVSSAEQMQKLIDDLLAYSRLTRSTIELSSISLLALVSDIRHQLEEQVLNRWIKWEIGSLPTIVTDGTLIYSVFLNLISNALKFTQHQSPAVITIDAEEADEEWILLVKDNGVGFDPHYKGKLFQMFQRLHSESEFSGSGIGLANVARAIKRLGGHIWAEGEVGKGASFYFSLPKNFSAQR
ncbi:MAG: PAS domain S-box protein [Chlamydiales bacterium]|nr:PAS domain S-box protein [Chlamydiales bacterium]